MGCSFVLRTSYGVQGLIIPQNVKTEHPKGDDKAKQNEVKRIRLQQTIPWYIVYRILLPNRGCRVHPARTHSISPDSFRTGDKRYHIMVLKMP